MRSRRKGFIRLSKTSVGKAAAAAAAAALVVGVSTAMAAGGFSQYATTPNEMAVGNYLNSLQGAGTLPTSISPQINAILSGSPSQVNTALNQLSPAVYQYLPDIALQEQVFFDQNVFQMLQDSYYSPGSSPAMGTMGGGTMNSNDMSTGQGTGADGGMMGGIMKYAKGLSVYSYYNWVSGDFAYSPSAAHFSASSVFLGTNYHWCKPVILGASISYTDPQATLDQFQSSAKLQDLGFQAYASYYKKGIFLAGLFDYSILDADIYRNINFDGSLTSARGDTGGSVYNVALEGGYDFKALKKHLIFGPLAGLYYTHVNVQGTSETSSPFGLSVSKQRVESLRSEIGGHVSYDMPVMHWLTLVPSLNAFYSYEYLNSSRGINASFVGTGSNAFTVVTNGPIRDTALMGFSLTAKIGKNIGVFTDYEAQFAGGPHTYAQSVTAGLQIGF